jgi:hypothetical protein
LVFDRAERLEEHTPALSKVLAFADFASWVPGVVEPQALRREGLTATRVQKGERKVIDVSKHLVSAEVVTDAAPLLEALDWPTGGTVVRWRLSIVGDGSAKPVEVIEALLGAAPAAGVRHARLGLVTVEPPVAAAASAHDA